MVDNHIALTLEYLHSHCGVYYDFARPHKTLANPYPRTPAMASGIADHIWTVEEIVKLSDGGLRE